MVGVLFECMFMVMVGMFVFSCCVVCVMLISGECRLCLIFMLSVFSGEMYSICV